MVAIGGSRCCLLVRTTLSYVYVRALMTVHTFVHNPVGDVQHMIRSVRLLAFRTCAMTAVLQQLLISHGFNGPSERMDAVVAACLTAGLGSLGDFDGVRDIQGLGELRVLLPIELSLMDRIADVATSSAAGFGEAMVHAIAAASVTQAAS